MPDRRYQQALDAGAGWTRWPMYWHLIETAPGRLDDAAYAQQDAVVARDRAWGLEVNAILLGTPQWALTAGSAAVAMPRVESARQAQVATADVSALSGAISPPQNLYQPVFDADGAINRQNYWGYFVYTTVTRYRDSVHVWEMWNEPDLRDAGGAPVFWSGSVEDYYQLLRVGYLAAKAADPSCTVLVGGLAYWSDPNFLPRLLDIAAADQGAAQHNYYFDALPFHIYVDAYDLYEIPQWARQQMLQRGMPHPVWVNEANVSVCDDASVDAYLSCPSLYRATMEEQANFVIQAYAVAAAAGVERVFVFQHYDDNVGPHDWFGLVRNDGTPRPAYWAYQVGARYLDRWEGVTQEDLGGARVVTFEQSSHGRVRVVWNRERYPVALTLPASTPTALLVDKRGVESTIYAADSTYSLELPAATYWYPAEGRAAIGGDPLVIVEALYSGVASQVDPLPAFAPAPSFDVHWSRLDGLGGEVTYTIEYREGADGLWHTWLSGVTQTAAHFGAGDPLTAVEGQSYYFRSRARDAGGLWEAPGPEDGDAKTTVPYFLRGFVRDNQGWGVAGAEVMTEGGAWATSSAQDGSFALGVHPSGLYPVLSRREGLRGWPPKLVGISPGASYNLYLAPEGEAVSNGGFEDGLASWDYEGPVYAKTFRHSGDWGAYLAGGGRLWQALEVSSGWERPTLSFVYRVPAWSTTGGMTVRLAGAEGQAVRSVPLVPDDTWRQAWLTVEGMAGAVELSFSAVGGDVVVWLDEVTVGPAMSRQYRLFLPAGRSGG